MLGKWWKRPRRYRVVLGGEFATAARPYTIQFYDKLFGLFVGRWVTAAEDFEPYRYSTAAEAEAQIREWEQPALSTVVKELEFC
jgi:hypothetical protein